MQKPLSHTAELNIPSVQHFLPASPRLLPNTMYRLLNPPKDTFNPFQLCRKPLELIYALYHRIWVKYFLLTGIYIQVPCTGNHCSVLREDHLVMQQHQTNAAKLSENGDSCKMTTKELWTPPWDTSNSLFKDPLIDIWFIKTNNYVLQKGTKNI